jgi:molybdenum cofactor cytidylyltransferase
MLSKSKIITTLIMAAGGSSRMGEPKQLLPWKGATLIEKSIDKALQLQMPKPIVVLGANSERIASKIESYPVKIIRNPNWERGLGNSIAFGVNYIQNNHQVDGVLVILADQPLINASYLKVMLDLFETKKHQIIATKYNNGKLGVPVLFDASYFQELSRIEGDKGAKSILEKYSNLVIITEVTTNIFDVDTKEDYNELGKQKNI